MGSFLGGSENFHYPYNHIYSHQHNKQRPLKMDRPVKRRRSVSPLNGRFPRSKRPTLVPIRSNPTISIRADAEFALIHTSIPTTPFNAAVESINERATRLELGNGDSQDIEMETCSQSHGETDEEQQKVKVKEEKERDGKTKYHKAITTGSHTSAPSILPLHKPHPIAYQQHLALIASNRSSKPPNCHHQSNCPKKTHNGIKNKFK